MSDQRDKPSVTDRARLAKHLRHVLWIGGSPCSGKSTIAHALARVYVFLSYFQDPMARNYFTRRVAAGDEEAQAFLRKTMGERWLQPSVDEMVSTTIASWTRDFQLVLEDLLAMPTEQFIFAEGNYFPACVAPYLTDSHQAIWLVPTAEFCATARRQKHAALAERQKRHGMYDEGSDPKARLRRLIERDIQLARYVTAQAEALGLSVHKVDGTQPPEAVMALVERHFDPYLIAAVRQATAR